MTSIRSFAEILLDERDLAADHAARYLRIIHDESVRLTRLLESTLDLSVLERGEAPWQTTPIDPEIALDSSIRTCSGLAASMGVRVICGERAAGVRVLANSDRLAQVFINLIANAVKYNTSDAPQLVITSRVRETRYEVLFEDNGPGIRPDERERIFAKFARGTAEARRDPAGAGLGLPISGQIMRRFGGSLTLLADRGPGACFCVALARA